MLFSERLACKTSDKEYSSVITPERCVQVHKGVLAHSPWFTSTEYTKSTFGFVLATLLCTMVIVSNNFYAVVCFLL